MQLKSVNFIYDIFFDTIVDDNENHDNGNLPWFL